MCDLFSLPIASHVRCKLLKVGYETAKDLSDYTAEQIASYAGIAVEEADALLQLIVVVVPRQKSSRIVTALQLLQCATEQLSDQRITTLCPSLDEVLGGGGVPTSRISEVCGTPGTGKTQLCLQLAVNVQLPRSLHDGLEGQAVYVDTEGSFFVERLKDIAAAAVEHFQQVASLASNPACLLDGSSSSFTVDGILRGIHYVLCGSRQHLESVVDLLEDFAVHHPKIKLIIVDSVAFHLREMDTEQISYADRTAFLFRLSQKLSKLAVSNSLAVVLTNQMTTRFVADGESYLVPALGDSWNHACPNRLLLSDNGDVRTVSVVKSPYLPDATATFHISSSGIRDAPKIVESLKSSERSVAFEPHFGTGRGTEQNLHNANKRVQIKGAQSTVPSKRFRQ